MEYDNWGCEFASEPPRPTPVPYLDNSLWLPVHLVNLAVSKQSLAVLNTEKVAYYRRDILSRGILRPGVLTVAPNGSLLTDGNHRFQACKSLGFERFPVLLNMQDEGIKIKGLPHQELVTELIKERTIKKYS